MDKFIDIKINSTRFFDMIKGLKKKGKIFGIKTEHFKDSEEEAVELAFGMEEIMDLLNRS